MLVIWMRENNSKKWNIGLKFVQFEKNNSHHSGINRSPYKAMFGCDAKIGLSSSSLPQEILGSLQTEEDLIQNFQSSDKPDEISNDKPNELSSDKPDEISNDKPNELSSDKPNELDEVSQLNAALNLSETQETGANVLVAIPHVDRGKGDPRNLMAVVTGKEEHGYKLGIKDGILRGLYTRNQFELSDTCDSNFIAIQCVNYYNEISFRKAVSKVSLCDGQGYTKCGCSASDSGVQHGENEKKNITKSIKFF
ncbi:unnamed protein product [Mytilus edulis]|uniref:Uncharacterized protein n=1 Tax=Mytilus edulis TaxID=6550 RepID=A0A8S3S3D5_MYTED|nr:unnamed protein product [Mytilus edulis]